MVFVEPFSLHSQRWYATYRGVAWPNAWQTAILRGARIRERSPPREAV